MLGYGKRFQKHRKLFHSTFSQAQAHTFEDAQTEEARILLKGLMDTPESYDLLIRRLTLFSHQRRFLLSVFVAQRYSTTLVMKIAYGHQILSDDDEYIKIAEKSTEANARAGSAGMTPPDLLPFCEFPAYSIRSILMTNDRTVRHIPAWVPGAWWSKFGRDWRFAVHDMFNIPFDRVREQMVCSHIQHEMCCLTWFAYHRTKGQHSHHTSPTIWPHWRLKEHQLRRISMTSGGQLGQSMQVRYDP
jgi:hypothetical protein